MDRMPGWLHSRVDSQPAQQPAGPGDAVEGRAGGNLYGMPARALHAAQTSPARLRSQDAGAASNVLSVKPKFRTHALDHIRARDSGGDEPPHHLLPLGPTVHGPCDASALLSPVPTALPTERGGPASLPVSSRGFHSMQGGHPERHRRYTELSPKRAISPISVREARALSPMSVNLTEPYFGAQFGSRPRTAPLSRLDHSSATQRARSPILSGPQTRQRRDAARANGFARAVSPIRHLDPHRDLDASFLTVVTEKYDAPNTSEHVGAREAGADSVENAIYALQHGQQPRSLNLRGMLDPEKMLDIDRLFSLISVAGQIQMINMSCNNFSDKMGWALERLLLKNRSCLTLRLGNNRMTDKMCSGVIASLHKNTLSNVKDVYLGNNSAGTLTCEALSKALLPGPGGLRKLRVLNISHNKLGDAGGSKMITALRDNFSLKVLDVGSNDLGFLSKGALCDTLKVNRTLEEIRIERNPGLEDQGLLDILTTLRFSMASQLAMLHTVEPLGMFAAAADHTGRETKHWDNRKVMQFVRDVRLWYGEDSRALFPISAQMWNRILRCIRKVENDLMSVALKYWHRAGYARAVARVQLARHKKQFIQRPYFHLWLNTLTQALQHPRFVEKMQRLRSKNALLYLTVWKLAHRPKSFFGAGKSWRWRTLLTEDSLHICQRAMGKADFAAWYGYWAHSHFLWHTVSVKNRNGHRRVMSAVVAVWSSNTQKRLQGVNDLRARRKRRLIGHFWQKWVKCKAHTDNQKLKLRRVGARLGLVGKGSALAIWKQSVNELKNQKRIIRKVANMLGFGLLGSAMASWKRLIAKKRHAANCMRKSENKALNLLTKREMWALAHWQSIKNMKKDQRLKDKVVVYRYGLRRCQVMLRGWHQLVAIAKALRLMLGVGSAQDKSQSLTAWRKEARGTRLYRKKYCRHLQQRAGACWRWRVDFDRAIDNLTKMLAKRTKFRMLQANCAAWKTFQAEEKSKRQKVALNLHRQGKRDEEQFFIAWVEFRRKSIRKKVAVRCAADARLYRLFMQYREGADVSWKQRKAANILFNFGEDYLLPSVIKAWHGWMMKSMKERVLSAQRLMSHIKETGLARLKKRIEFRPMLHSWRHWRLATGVPKSFLRGYEAYRGLLRQPQLRELLEQTTPVRVPSLLEIMCLEEAGDVGAMMTQVLMLWYRRQSDGDLDYKLELHRFMSFLFGTWTAGNVPAKVVFGKITLAHRGENLLVTRQDNVVHLTLPRIDTTLELESKIQRAITRDLSAAFGSALSLPCPLLIAAHDFCREFLRVPIGFLDSRGDHELWQEKRTRPVGDPARNYVCPQGWARVGIHVDDAIVQQHQIWDKWNVSYHSVRQEMVAQVIHSRTLLRPGDVSAKGRIMHTIPGKIEFLGNASEKTKFVVVPQSNGPDAIQEYNSKDKAHRPEAGAEEFKPAKHFLTTPSVVFASQLRLAAPVSWRGRNVQVLLQTRQRPDATRVLAFHDEMHAAPVDYGYANEELRWFTSSYGPAVIAVTGILFRFCD